MRRLAHLLCVLLAVSSMLTPFSRLHAHIAGEAVSDRHADVHGGHEHGAGGVDLHEDVVGNAIDLQSDSIGRAHDVSDLLPWFVVAFVILARVPRHTLRLPLQPRIRTRPPSPCPYFIPLLRGPPHSI